MQTITQMSDTELLAHVLHLQGLRSRMLESSKKRRASVKTTKIKFESAELEALFNKLPTDFQKYVTGGT